MKYSADVAEAWQPLGENVSFIRCAKAGRNAVDMHIAFYLGELIEFDDTNKIFTSPSDRRTQDYITGRFG